MRVADCVAWLQWANSEDAQNGKNQPNSIVKMMLGTDEKPDKELQGFENGDDFFAKWNEN